MRRNFNDVAGHGLLYRGDASLRRADAGCRARRLRRRRRTPELGDSKTLEWIGRFIGRIHARGATKKFRFREALTLESFGTGPRAWLLANNFIPADLLEAWKAVTEQALSAVKRIY